MEHVIAIDAGTTGVTGVLLDADLEPRARAYREFPQHFPRPGWVEHEGSAILRALDEVLEEIFAQPAARDAIGIGLTNQRETVFALERSSGSALRPGIVWQDRRTAARCRELEEAGELERVRRHTGLLLDPYFSATKIEWMLREDADLATRAARGEVLFATVDTLVVAHLTSNRVQATEPTNASRTMLFDLDAGAWDPDLCELFGVDPAWLAEVRPSAGSFGTTDPARTGGRALPVHGVAGDQQAALFGQGCVEPGDLKTTYGTGAFLLMHTGDERVDSSGGLLTTRAVAADGGPAFALEGSVFMCGAVVQWLRDGLGLIARSEEVEALARSVPDAGGVILVPAFTGLGAPYWDPEARGALLGLTRGTTRAHVARAALEAMALQVAELVELLRVESGLPVDLLLADGGAAANDLLLELQADLGGLTVRRPPSVEATARGAGALAAVGLGLIPDGRVARSPKSSGAAFGPRLGAAERAERLARWREAVGRVLTRRAPC